jgi:hypothetical protein
MRVMRLERTDPSLPVAEDDELHAEQLHLLRQIAQLIQGADRQTSGAAFRAARSWPAEVSRAAVCSGTSCYRRDVPSASPKPRIRSSLPTKVAIGAAAKVFSDSGVRQFEGRSRQLGCQGVSVPM